MGMDCLAFSVISDLGVEGKIVRINHEMVVEEVKKVANRMQGIIKELVSKI
jgi:purine nucleoside phosphorylase